MSKRIESLQNLFLPDKEDELGEYDQEQQDKARAFVLLAHAEIENYLESLSVDAGTKASASIDSGSCGAFASRFLSLGVMRYSAAGKQEHRSLSDIGKAILGLHKTRVGANNGIKKESLTALFGIFLFENELNSYPELTSSLDSLGSLRGEYAHSSQMGITKTINPFDCKNQVRIALDKLTEFSGDFERLINTGSLTQEASTAESSSADK